MRYLAIPDMKTIGDTIKALRKAKNLKQGELAKRLKMTSAQLCRIEGSKNAPSIKTLARVAKALGVSLSELMSDSMPTEKKTVICSSDDSRVYAASDEVTEKHSDLIPVRQTGEAVDEMENIRSQIHTKISQYANLENDLGIPGATTLPLCFTFSNDERGAEILARTLRDTCAAGTTPFADLPALLESKHVRIVLVRSSIDIQSRSFFEKTSRVLVIAVNKKLPAERQLYRIAYELGYACLFGSTGFSTVIEQSNTHKFVRRFAAAFLMPEEAIKELASQLALGPTNWTMKILLQLKYRFGVSAETFAHRLERIGVLAPALRKRFKEELHNYYEEHNNAEPPPTIKPLNADSMLGLLKLRAKL